MEASAETVIDRPREAVFEFMDVPENQGRISPRLSAVETRGVYDNGGKRAEYVYRLFGIPFSGEVHGIEHEPPERVVFEMTGDVEGRIEWRFDPVDGGTRVTYSADYDLGLPPVLGRVVAPVAALLNRRELERTLRSLDERISDGGSFQ